MEAKDKSLEKFIGERDSEKLHKERDKEQAYLMTQRKK